MSICLFSVQVYAQVVDNEFFSTLKTVKINYKTTDSYKLPGFDNDKIGTLLVLINFQGNKMRLELTKPLDSNTSTSTDVSFYNGKRYYMLNTWKNEKKAV